MVETVLLAYKQKHFVQHQPAALTEVDIMGRC